jgi:hypothetical protein
MSENVLNIFGHRSTVILMKKVKQASEISSAEIEAAPSWIRE